MLDALKQLFPSVFDDAEEGPDTDPLRLASAALLIHVGFADGTYTEAEERRLEALLRERFKLSDAEVAHLMRAGEREESAAVDLYRFTRVLNDGLEQEGRQDIVAMLWDVAMADGEIAPYEENLIAKVSELLGVSTRDRVRLRKMAEGAGTQTGGADDRPSDDDAERRG